MEKVYKILQVQERKPWTGAYGTFNSFALRFEGVDNWVEISQKQETPAPVVGAEIFGKIEVQTRGENTFYKFKKGDAKNSPHAMSVGSISKEDVAYIIMMLEELTLRRESPDNPKTRDVTPTELEGSTPFDLSEIPF